MRIPFLSILIGVVISFLVIALIIRTSLFSSSTTETGKLQTPAVTAQTTLERTGGGMVHIDAATVSDAYTALGFVHARDRLWQLQRFRWAAHSAYTSRFGSDYLLADKLSSALLYTGERSVQESLDISDEDYRLFGNYARGINAYIAKTGRHYPIQFTITDTTPELWDADDVARLFALQLWLHHTRWQQELANSVMASSLPPSLLPYLYTDDTIELMHQIQLPESAKESFSKLLYADAQLRELLNAPRQLEPIRSVSQQDAEGNEVSLVTLQSGPQAPSYWYDISVSIQNQPPVTGFTIPGTPILWTGSNERYSWVPESGYTSADLILPAGEDTRQERMLINTSSGEEALFRFTMNTDGFLIDDTPESPVVFNRLQHNSGRMLDSFRRAAFGEAVELSGPSSDETGMYPLSIRPAAPGDTFSSGTTGFSEHISQYLNQMPLFDTQRPLMLQEANAHETHPERREVAFRLSEILTELTTISDIDISRQYLSNWDGQYDRYAVAATLIELSLMKIAENALRNYLDEKDFELLQEIGLIDQVIGTQLIDAHYTAMNSETDGISPVSNAFFARRVQEALQDLRKIAGTETFEWRWGNVNKNTFTDRLLCGYEEEQLRNRSNACVRIERAQNVPVLGQEDLLNAALIYSDGNQIRSHALTTAVLQTIRNPGQSAKVHSVILPGHSSDPFSIYYTNGLNSWPPYSVIPRTVDSTILGRFLLTPN